MSTCGHSRLRERAGPLLLAAALCAAPAVAGCSAGSPAGGADSPATVEQVSEDIWRIRLTPRAAERTGVQTAEVERLSGSRRTTVPYSAVMYHYDGSTWAYTNPEPLTYVRSPIEIDHVDGDVAVLVDGPPVGTRVVSVGAAELYGVEFGIGK